MLAHKARADLALASHAPTSDINKAVVYVELDKDGVLYYQSNFVTPGVDESGKPFHPTKVKGSPGKNPVFANVEQVFKNIVGDQEFAEANEENIKRAFDNSATFLVDTSAIQEDGIPVIDLGNARNIRIVDTQVPRNVISDYLVGRQEDPSIKAAVPTTGAAEVLRTAIPPPSLISKIKGCCLYGRPPHEVGRFSAVLREAQFDARRVKVASLVIDSETRDALTSSKRSNASLSNFDVSSMRRASDMTALLEGSRGSTLILLAHTEGSSYVIRRADGTEQFSIPIADVRKMARELKVSLIDIGCDTAKTIEQSSLGFAVINRYRPAEAVRSVERALTVAKNHEEFLSSISSEGLKIVVDKTYFSNNIRTSTSTIYSRLASKIPTWTKVGVIGMTDAPAAWYVRAARRFGDLVN